MNAAPFFEAEDATELLPLGTCSVCRCTDEAMTAVFWPQDLDGNAVCPDCAGVVPTEGYPHWIAYCRNDRRGEMSRLVGPYSATEAERNLAYFRSLENVESAWILQLPEAR